MRYKIYIYSDKAAPQNLAIQAILRAIRKRASPTASHKTVLLKVTIYTE
jgi:hypothetical protein